MPERKPTKRDLQKLKELISADDALRTRLGSVTTGRELYAELIRVGATHGLTLTEEQIALVISERSKGQSDELRPEEIASLAGGFHIYPPKTATVNFGDTLIRTSRWFGIPLRRE